MSQNVLAVDLDGTLAKKQEPFSIHTVGEPVQPILDYVKDELAKGRKVVCFTARASHDDPKLIKPVRAWLDKHGLKEVGITAVKTPDITELLDDRAFGINADEGTLKAEHPVLEKNAGEVNKPQSGVFLHTLQKRNGGTTGLPKTPPLQTGNAYEVNAAIDASRDGKLSPGVSAAQALAPAYGAGWPNALESAQAYQKANPHLPFVNDVSTERMQQRVPLRSVPGLGAGRVAGQAVPSRLRSFAYSIFGTPNYPDVEVQLNPDYADSAPEILRHEMRHTTQPHYADGYVLPNAEGTNMDQYTTSPAEIMARLPEVNAAWVRRGGEFPRNPEEARKALDHYFGEPTVPGGTPEGEYMRGERQAVPSDVRELRDALLRMPDSTREKMLERMSQVLPGVVDAGQVDTVKAAAEVLISLPDADLSDYMESVDRRALQTKIAASYVRRTKLVEQHSDHCPHCDHEFSEKGYPRPDPDDEDPMTADSICPHCRGHIEQQELSDQEIDSAVEWLRPGMRKHRESLRARRERQIKQAAVNLVCWNSPETNPLDGELEKEAKARPDKLRRLWLRQGRCPACGGDRADKAEDTAMCSCSKCDETWSEEEAKAAGEKLTFEEKPAKRFMRPENWDPYDKKRFVTLYCGCNDWEQGQTWLWAEGEDKRAWIQLKFENGHPSYERVTPEMDAAFKKQYKAAQAMWDRCAAKDEQGNTSRGPASIDQYIAALERKEMKPFILASGVDKLMEHEKQAAASAPRTGPRAIANALKNLNLDELEKQARADIATGKVTKREKGVRMLQAISGLRRNEMQPHELMITKVPVLPPAFRPFSLMGSTYIPGNANELYADLFKHRDIHKQTVKELGEAGGSLTRRNLLNAVRALYGYGDPVSPKLVERRTKGFLQEITGAGPKHSFFQKKMISKPLDSIGRGVITVDPDLGMNQISLPKDMAWTLYGSFVQRRLAQQGFSPFDAVKAVKDRTRDAELALQAEMQEGSGRPVIYSRAPSWHKFNTIGGWARMHDGDNIAINPYTAAGLGADFDGDTLNVNVPIMDDSVQEAKEKLMPDKMLFSIRNQDQSTALPKQEMILGLFANSIAPSKQLHRFGSKQEALAAAKRGDVGLSDEIEYPDD